MNDSMNLEDYLAQGGKLTSPGNASSRYRAELLRLMASFVDSELAGAAGFADIINAAPGLKERIAAAKIVLEKNDHAAQVLELMGQFGANTERYANHHPWTDRLERDAKIDATRAMSDMRLAVFNYPLDGWVDAVVMNLLMGNAVGIQLGEYLTMSYQPLAEAFREIAPRENRHAQLALEGLEKLLASGEKAKIEKSISYWWPRVERSFGSDKSDRANLLMALGLRKTDNATLRNTWRNQMESTLNDLKLKAPA